jgi:OOP family OmpA-OmpF porin
MKGTVWLGLLGLLILCVLCPYCRAPAIEENLQSQAAASLGSIGLDRSLLDVSGCVVTLSGSVASQELKDQARQIVEAIPGICRVSDSLTVPTWVPGSLRFATRGGALDLEGLVPSDQVRSDLVTAARELWGDAGVAAALTVEPKLDVRAWPDSFLPLLLGLHYRGRDLEVELTDGRAIITGEVVGSLTRRRILGAAETLLPGFEIVDRLTIREPATDLERLQARLDEQLEDKIVEFDSDSVNLTAKGRAVLDVVVAIMKETPGRVEIGGHTDSTHTTEHNLELSRRRAESVRDYLVKKGVRKARLETVGYGETRPIATNETPEGRQHNRRTEFQVLEEN